jgi:hypothetical protein
VGAAATAPPASPAEYESDRFRLIPVELGTSSVVVPDAKPYRAVSASTGWFDLKGLPGELTSASEIQQTQLEDVMNDPY